MSLFSTKIKGSYLDMTIENINEPAIVNEEQGNPEEVREPQGTNAEEVEAPTDAVDVNSEDVQSTVEENKEEPEDTTVAEEVVQPEVTSALTQVESDLDSIRKTSPILYPIQVNHDSGESEVEAVAVEAFTQWMPGTDFMNSVSDFFKSFTNKLGEAADKLSELGQKIKSDFIGVDDNGLSKMSRYVAGRQYFAISKTAKVYQPHQLGVDWLTYANWLNDVTAVVSSIDRDLLGPIAEYLGRAINKPDNLSSIGFKPKYQEKDYDAIKTQMKRIFSGATTEKVYFGRAFNNNGDVEQFRKVMQQVSANTQLLLPETVQKSTQLIRDRANLIADGINKPDSKYVLNKKQSEYISEVLYLTAQYVTLYSVVLALVDEFYICIKTTAANLK